jgi:hypothetical protein
MTFDLSPATLEAERHRFAEYVIALAATCRSNTELLDRMTSDLPASFFQLTGTGTTRRCYGTKIGVCLKLQRESPADDPLDAEEFAYRGGPDYSIELWGRRRGANIAEMIFSAKFPRLMPRVYGFLAALGWVQTHPSILIAETCRPLTSFIPNDRFGVFTENIGIDADGHLWVFDPRMTTVKRPAHMRTLEGVFKNDELKIQLANLGVTPAGNYVFLDRSDHGGRNDNLLSGLTLAPLTLGWQFFPTPAQDLTFSKDLFAQYDSNR